MIITLIVIRITINTQLVLQNFALIINLIIIIK